MICCGGDALFASQQLAPLSQLCVAALGSVESGSLWDRDDSEGSSHFSRTGNLESSCTWKSCNHFTGPNKKTWVQYKNIHALALPNNSGNNHWVLPKRCNHFSGPKKWFNIRTFTPYHCRRVPKTTVFCQVLPHYRFQMIWTTPSYTAFYMAMLHRKTLLLWTDHFPHTDSLAAPWQPRLRHEVLKPVLVFLQRLLTSRTVGLSEADVGALAQQVVGRFHQWPRTGDL